jgi:nitrogen fixation NifU-like protein
MADAKELYGDIILDHYRKPHNYRSLDGANREAEAVNDLCGDRLRVFLLVEKGLIRDICFSGSGCAISMASASMMTDRLKGKTEAEAGWILDLFTRLLSGNSAAAPDSTAMGDLTLFAGLREYPVRAKCALLPWTALRSALSPGHVAIVT